MIPFCQQCWYESIDSSVESVNQEDLNKLIPENPNQSYDVF